jgi:RHS repeat-associated protein
LALSLTVTRASASGPPPPQGPSTPCTGAPQIVTVPTISETRGVAGGTLTTSNGVWSTAVCPPTDYTYAWFRSGTTPSVATTQSYSPVKADVDHTLTVQVTGCNAYGCTGPETDSNSSLIYESALGLRRQYTPVAQVGVDDQESLQVNVADGDLLVQANDFSLPGVAGLDYRFTRSYNSLNNSRSSNLSNLFNPTLSTGWEYVTDLAFFGNGDARYTGLDGYEITFANNGTSYTSPPGSDATLVQNPDGTYLLKFYKTGMQEKFNSVGKLIDEIDRNNNTIAYSWSGGLLRTVTDTTTRATSFAYNGSNQLTSITAPCSGAPPNFSGSASSTGGSLATGTYYYEVTAVSSGRESPASSEISKAVTGPTGSVSLTWTPIPGATSYKIYRGTTSGGENTYYTNPTASFTDTGGAGTSGSPPGASGTCTYSYTYNASNQLASFTDPASGQPTNYAYNASGLLQSITNPLGNQWKIAYDSQDRVASITGGLNSSGTCQLVTCPVTSFTYTAAPSSLCSTGMETDVTDPNGNTTKYCSDGRARVAEISDPLGITTSTDYTDTVFGGANCVDANGVTLDDKPCSTTDGRGYTTQYGYDAGGQNLSWEANPQQSPPPSTHHSSWAYDPGKYEPSSFTDANGKTTNYSYTASGNLFTKVDPLTNKTTYCYDSSGELTYEYSPLAGTVTCGQTAAGETSYVYDTANTAQGTIGDLASKTDPVTNTTTYCYDPAGKITEQIDPKGNVACGASTNYKTISTYDSDGRLLGTTNQLGYTTAYAYDAAGNEATITDANTHVTTDCYDALNELTAEYDALAGTVNCSSPPSTNRTLYAYDAAGNKLTETDQLQHVTSYCYDADNRLISEFSPRAGTVNCQTPPSSYKTSYTYDADGNVVTEVSPTNQTSGAPTTYCYDHADQLIYEYSPLAGSVTCGQSSSYETSYTYDYVGNKTSETDPGPSNGTQTDTTYNADNQVSSVTAGMSWDSQTGEYDCLAVACPVTTYTYDPDGNVKTEVSPDNQSSGTPTTYCYDNADELHYQYNPLAGTITTCGQSSNYETIYSYDPNGNLSSKQTGMGTITYGYDPANQLTTISYQNASTNHNAATPNVSYTYDPVGNRQSMTDGGSGTVNYAYDALDQLCAVVRGGTANCANPASGTFSYTYDAAGEITNRTYPDGTSVASTYDADGNLSTVASGGATTSYTYYQDDSLNTTTLPSTTGYTETRTYDNAGQLATIKTSNGTDLAKFVYTLNALGSPTSVAETGSDQTCTVTNTYDNIQRLATANYTSGCLKNTGDVNSFSWNIDKDGNWTSQTKGTDSPVTYTNNAADQLTSVSGVTGNYTYDYNGNETYDPSTGHSYTYDLENRVITDTCCGSNLTTSTFTYDGDGRRITATTGTTTTNYTWDTNTGDGVPEVVLETNSGTLVNRYIYGNARISDTTPSGISYYVYDGLGSVVNTISSTGATQSTLAYEPYGGLRYPTTASNEMQFTGYAADPSSIPGSTVYDSPTRIYDTTTGRFVSQDPVGQSGDGYASLYSYASDAPATYVDPSGMVQELTDGGGGSEFPIPACGRRCEGKSHGNSEAWEFLFGPITTITGDVPPEVVGVGRFNGILIADAQWGWFHIIVDVGTVWGAEITSASVEPELKNGSDAGLKQESGLRTTLFGYLSKNGKIEFNLEYETAGFSIAQILNGTIATFNRVCNTGGRCRAVLSTEENTSPGHKRPPTL